VGGAKQVRLAYLVTQIPPVTVLVRLRMEHGITMLRIVVEITARVVTIVPPCTIAAGALLVLGKPPTALKKMEMVCRLMERVYISIGHYTDPIVMTMMMMGMRKRKLHS